MNNKNNNEEYEYNQLLQEYIDIVKEKTTLVGNKALNHGKKIVKDPSNRKALTTFIGVMLFSLLRNLTRGTNRKD